jgi:hypothetical protein
MAERDRSRSRRRNPQCRRRHVYDATALEANSLGTQKIDTSADNELRGCRALRITGVDRVAVSRLLASARRFIHAETSPPDVRKCQFGSYLRVTEGYLRMKAMETRLRVRRAPFGLPAEGTSG